MKQTTWLVLIPGAILASLGVALIVLMNVGSPIWTCSCDDADHWQYVGPNGVAEGESHFDAARHTTSCKRTDRAAKVMDRVYGLIFGPSGLSDAPADMY